MEIISFKEFLSEGAMTGGDLTKHGMKYLKAVVNDILSNKPIRMKNGESFTLKIPPEIEKLIDLVNRNEDPSSIVLSGKKYNKIFTDGVNNFSWTEIEKTVYSIGIKDEKTITHLKPSVFLGNKEKFSSAEELKTDLLNGISGSNKISDGLKKTLMDLVNAVSKNTDKIDLDFESKSYLSMINKDFSEALGPLKIMNDPNYMPWIPRNNYEIYIPKKSNYALADYIIFDKGGEIPIPYKISAKVIKGVGNTVKISDIIDILNNAEMIGKEFSLLSKMKSNRKFKTLFDVLDGVQGKKDRGFGPLSAFAGLYGAAEIDKTFKKSIGYLEKSGVKNISLKDLSDLKISDESLKVELKSNFGKYVSGDVTNFDYVADILVAANSFLKIQTKVGILKNPLKFLVNFALSNQVFYAKFGVGNDGSIKWDIRGGARVKGYEFGVGGKEFGVVYLDDKSGNGSRNRIGKDTIGLRIEQVERVE